MRAINLIPPEDRRGERAPLRGGPIAYIVVGVLLLAFVGVYATVSTGNSIAEKESEVAGLEQRLATSQARAQALSSFSDFASMEDARTVTVTDLAESRFDWERILRELALVIPEDVTLLTLSGSVGGEGSEGADTALQAPSMLMNGCGPSHESVARMVASLRDIDGVTRVGLTSSTKSTAASGGAPAAAGATTDPGATTGEPVGACSAGGTTTFDITVAFDEVSVDPASGGIVVPEQPEPAPGDGSGVAETQAERAAGQESVDSAREQSSQAVDNYVPGT